MFEQIKSIIIKGGPFLTDTPLELIPNRMNLLYGRNGSGKSTIAKCIKCLGKEEENNAYSAKTIPECDSFQRIFVFDEDFVSSNFKIEREGLSSIVMLGHQVGLDDRLKEIETELKQLSAKKQNLSDKQKQFEDQKDTISPLWHFNEIKKKLSADEGWADYDKRIKGNSIKSSVTVDVIEELMKIPTNLSKYSEAEREFNKKYDIYQKVKKGGVKIELLSSNVCTNNVDALQVLYEKRLEEPCLSDRDKKIIELIHSEHGSYLEQVHPIFDNDEMTVCPLCLRPIASYEKNELFSKVRHFFNEETEHYKQQLQSVIYVLAQWKAIELTDIVKEVIGEDIVSMFDAASQEMLIVYSKLKEALEDRKKNVYGIRTYLQWYDLKEAQDKYSKTIDKINVAISDYNKEVERRFGLRKELIHLNKIIYAFRLRKDFSWYRLQSELGDKNSKALNEVESQLQSLSIEKAEIHSKKAQVTIALDFINEALSYIFFDKNRLVLQNHAGTYVLKSNGRDVKPKDISTGERNAIALCYFFGKVFENREQENRYSDELLVVLDDPITSFDKENKVGMMSFLRWQINEMLKGNTNTKLLIMTHDLMTAFNIQKVFDDINGQYSVKELKDCKLDDLNKFHNKRNEYNKLLDDVFAVANNTSSDILSVGNKMRKIEEAYSSFISNKSFVKLLHDEEFLQNVPEGKKHFYQNFMSRLVLNSESHTEEAAYNMADFAQMFDEDEIRKTAKFLLMLFYYVDRFHLKSYLKDKFTIVEQWIKDDNVG